MNLNFPLIKKKKNGSSFQRTLIYGSYQLEKDCCLLSWLAHILKVRKKFSRIFRSTDFPFPKPSYELKSYYKTRLVDTDLKLDSKNNEDIILDFFAGSCTTAQAVMRLNSEDGGNRKFIMIQLRSLVMKTVKRSKPGLKIFQKSAKKESDVPVSGSKQKLKRRTSRQRLTANKKQFPISASASSRSTTPT